MKMHRNYAEKNVKKEILRISEEYETLSSLYLNTLS